MSTKITARHFDLTSRTKTHVEERVGKFSRIFDQIQDCSVVLTKERNRYMAEITLLAGGGADIIGHDENDDLFGAIDKAGDRVETQLRKHKGRLQRKPTGGTKVGVTLAAEAAAEAEAEADTEED